MEFVSGSTLCFCSPVINFFLLLSQNEITSNKVLFVEHLPLSMIQTGIKNGSLLQGTFRASRDNYLEATVFVPGGGEDGTEVCESTFMCELTTSAICLAARGNTPVTLLPGSHPGSSEPQQSCPPGCCCRATVTTKSVGGAVLSHSPR